MITNSQIKKIHTLKTTLKLDDELYRDILANYGAESCKNLSPELAGELIEQLETMAINSGVWTKRKMKFENLSNRFDMATPKQLRMIESMWSQVMLIYAEKKEVHYVDKEEFIKKSLRKFLLNKFSVSDLRFLDRKAATKVINTVKEIQKQYLNAV